MNWIVENYDKWIHFLISGMMAVWFIMVPKRLDSKWIGFVACMVFALGKEYVWDLWLGHGTFEWLDFVYTMILPTLVMIVSLLIKRK